jgi:hypothetical protein
MKTKLMMLYLVLGSWGAFAQHDHAKKSDEKMDQSMAMFKDAKLGTAYEHYIHVKDALVASSASDAKKAAGELETVLQATSGKKAAQTAGDIAKAKSIEEQRMLFTVLSDEMTVLIKDSKLSSGVIYLEYCPMANNNEGAYWLSNNKEIKNPYFGDKMLKCGSVKEMIH